MSLQCRPHMEPSGVPCIRPPMPPGQKRLRLPVMTVNGKEPDAKGNVVVVDPPDLTELEGRIDGLADAVDEENQRAVGAEEELGRRIAAEESRAQSVERGLRDDVSSAQTAIADRYTKRETDEKIAAATPSDYDAVKGRVAAVEAKVPAQATAQNQLADKDFVNSSIATETAAFRGTFNLVTDLQLPLDATHEQVAAAVKTELGQTAYDGHDYVFVQIPQDLEHTDAMKQVDRYKCVETGTDPVVKSWEYEWTLNNSSFTAAQWAAINSGITSGAVAKLGALPTAAELAQALAGKMPSNATGADIAVSGSDATKISAALAGKRDYTDRSYNTQVTVNAPALHAILTSHGTQTLEYYLPCTEDIPATPEINHAYLWRRDGARFYITQEVSALTTIWTLLDSSTGNWLASTTTDNATQGYFPDLTFEMAHNDAVTSTKVNSYPDGVQYALALAAHDPTAGNLAALDADGNPTDSGLSKDDVESLFFAQYYPDGSVKSAAEFTQGIKYDAPNTTNRTITVKPFCNTGTAANDNSNLSGRVVIPPFVNASGNGYISDDGTRYKVVGVGSGTDSNNPNENLTAVIAPSTVANIKDKAFRRCTKLASVSAPAATSIGSGAFNTCTSLASVSLPAAESIGTFAFNSCTKLASVSIPAATNIYIYAFYSCTKLTSVSIPAAKSIGGHVFDGCTKLASVSLPAATSVWGSAFNNCNSLASVSLPVVTSIDGYSFAGCTSLTSVDFGETLSSAPTLGSNAFRSVPTSCKIIVPDAQYDAWTVASGWRDLYNNGNGYKFLKHSEWEYARKYEVSQEIQDAIDGIKPTRIYNSAGTDALDDKGGLHKSDIVQSSWTLKKSGTATTYTFSYAGRNAGNNPNLFWWAQDGQNYSWMTYNPTTGVIDYVAGGTLIHTNLGTTEYGLDPSTGDVLPDISGITIKMFPTWATISGDLTFTPTQVQLLSESYTHLAVESVPTRTIAASTVYAVGDLLGDDGKAYRCIQEYTSDATPVAPSLDMTRWEEVPVLKAVDEQLAGKATKADATLTPVAVDAWSFSDGLTHAPEPTSRENAFGGWEYSYGVSGTAGVIRYDPQTWFNTEEERDAAAKFTWDIYEFDGTEEVKTGTLVATRVIAYQLGGQETKPLQPAGNYVKTPVYDGQNHEFLDAEHIVDGENFALTGMHRWTMPRRGVVYIRLINNSTSGSTIRIGVNVAAGAEVVDDAHCITALSQFKGDANQVVPLFLNANDEVSLSITANKVDYVLFSVFYTD